MGAIEGFVMSAQLIIAQTVKKHDRNSVLFWVNYVMGDNGLLGDNGRSDIRGS